MPFFAVSRAQRATWRNPSEPAGVVGVHKSDARRDPRNPRRPAHNGQRHRRGYCPQEAPTREGDSGSVSRRRTPALRLTSAWQLGAVSQWANGPDTTLAPIEPKRTGRDEPAAAVPYSAGPRSPHTRMPSRPASDRIGPDYARYEPAPFAHPPSRKSSHRAHSLRSSCPIVCEPRGEPPRHTRADAPFVCAEAGSYAGP